MLKRKMFMLMLVGMAIVILNSCEPNNATTPVTDQSVSNEISVGQMHNEFVKAFIIERSNYTELDTDQYFDLYLETSQRVCLELGIDFVPTRQMLDDFLGKCNAWSVQEMCDIFDITRSSPLDVIDNLAATGIIPAEDVLTLKSIFSNVKLAGLIQGERGLEHSSFIASDLKVSDSVKAVDDIIIHSCQLWYGKLGNDPINIGSNDPLMDKWWKKVVKYVAVGVADGLAAAAGTYATGGNVGIGAFCAGVASVATIDAFNERGW